MSADMTPDECIRCGSTDGVEVPGRSYKLCARCRRRLVADVMGDAVTDPTGTYRYSLQRWWLFGSGRCCFVMLNPSTADALVDDPTIRRCVRFAQRWGYAHLEVVNLYAYRATDPAELGRVDDPVGPDNVTAIDDAICRADVVVCAWGARMGPKVWDSAAALIVAAPDMLACLGTTKGGHPRHPLYVRADQPLVPFTLPELSS